MILNKDNSFLTQKLHIENFFKQPTNALYKLLRSLVVDPLVLKLSALVITTTTLDLEIFTTLSLASNTSV